METETNDDGDLLLRLRAGEESAFADLVGRYHVRLTRLAVSFGAQADLAQDIAQETWVAVLHGLDRFEGRSSLQSWLFQICANRARSITARERRLVPVAPEGWGDVARAQAAQSAGTTPDPAEASAEAALADRIRQAIDELDGTQGLVVALRDDRGLSSDQVCDLLSISAANQRVLLHRGRARVRAAVGRAAAPSAR